MEIIVKLELSESHDLTDEEIEKDIRMSEDQIGWSNNYIIRSIEVI